MSTLRISDAPLLPDVDGTEKIPTGGRGDYAISVDQIKYHIFQDVGKELVGLGNVDNTSDLDKPVSTAQQAALNLKADKTYVDTNLERKADKTNVYTRSETTLALSKKADLVNGVIPENQIPSSFNDVLEFTTLNLPIVGESGKIYVTTDNNKTWRWGGNKYVEISGWNPDSVSKVSTIPTYKTKELGVDHTVGVNNGAYFNVRSTDDDTMLVEYQNVGGSAVATGKSYLSAFGVERQEKPASTIKDASGKWQHEINEDLDKRVKIVTPYLFGAKGNRIDDDTQAIRDFFNYCASNLVITADWTGDFLIKGDILADTGSTTSWKDKPTYCQNFTGHMTLRSDYASDGYMLTLKNFNDANFNGKMTVIGKGISYYAARTNGHGILIEDCKKFKFDQIETWYFKGRGLVIHGTSTEFIIDALDQWYCGTSAGAASSTNLALTTPTYENVGMSGVNTQRCKVTVGAGTIPTVMQVNDFILFFNSAAQYSEAKRVTSIDRATNSFEVYPWVLDSDKAYTPFYVVGGGYYAEGGDTSAGVIVKHSTLVCGVGNNSQSLYPTKVLNQISQFNGIASVIGDSGSEGGCILSNYYEANGINDLQAGESSGVYLGSVAPEAEPWKRSHLQAGVLSGANYIRGNATSSRVVQKSGRLPIAAGNQLANSASDYIPVISTSRPTVANFTAIRTNGGGALGSTIKLSYDVITNREYGLDTVELFIHGGTSLGGVANNVTIQPSEAGHTVNGLAELSLKVTEPTLLICRWINNDWKVFSFTATNTPQNHRRNSVVYDPPSIDAGLNQVTTVLLQGVKVGDPVVAAFTQDHTDIEIYSKVTAQDTVTVKFKNVGSAAVDLPSGTLTVKLI